MKAGQQGGDVQDDDRTQRDLPLRLVTVGTFLVLGLVFLFFWFIVKVTLVQAVVGLLLVAGISFLFTTVAARAIAIVGSNPVSGMTLMTLIISSVVLRAVGLSGPDGIVAALLIGGVVCTALSMSGGFVSDLKIGYWLGTTPATQQKWKFLGTIVAAVSVTGVIMMLNATYGFTSDAAARAPGQRHGRGHRAADDRPAGALAAVHGRRVHGPDPGVDRPAGPGLRPGHVPAAVGQHPGARRRPDRPLGGPGRQREDRRASARKRAP